MTEPQKIAEDRTEKSRLYRFGERHVIGDRCPCDKCGSDVKMRAFAVLAAPAIVTIGVTNYVVPEYMTVAALGVMAVWYLVLRGTMFAAINDQMPETCPNTGAEVSA